jgi:hypothetical protein
MYIRKQYDVEDIAAAISGSELTELCELAIHKTNIGQKATILAALFADIYENKTFILALEHLENLANGFTPLCLGDAEQLFDMAISKIKAEMTPAEIKEA